GLGVGIDYSLFIVTRYRENRATGMEIEAAVGRSVATAGSAVLFAGTTVVIAICGLVIAGIPYVARLGYMAGIVVAVMMTAALTLLPAIIAVVGTGIDRWKVPSLIRHPDRAVAAGEDPTSPAGTVWERLARLAARHERRAGVRRRHHRFLHRHRRPDQRPSPLLHRRRGAVVVLPADARVPLDPRAAHRRGDEPALGRGRVRRHRGGVPMGMGEGPH